MKKRKATKYTQNGRTILLDQQTLRFVANELMRAHKYLTRAARQRGETLAHAYICADSWAEAYRHLARSAK